MDRLKAVAAAAGASLNDVYLALCGGALRRYLLERDQLGMLDQVHAVLTGFGDPAAVRLVVAYAVLLGVLLVITRRLGMSRAGAG